MAKKKVPPHLKAARLAQMREANRKRCEMKKEVEFTPIPEYIMVLLHRRWKHEDDCDNSTMHTGGGDGSPDVPATTQAADDDHPERSTIQRVLRSADSGAGEVC